MTEIALNQAAWDEASGETAKSIIQQPHLKIHERAGLTIRAYFTALARRNPPPEISLADQIACVRRELAMRDAVYPHRIRAGKMTEAQAELEKQRMRAVLRSLETLAVRTPEA